MKSKKDREKAIHDHRTVSRMLDKYARAEGVSDKSAVASTIAAKSVEAFLYEGGRVSGNVK